MLVIFGLKYDLLTIFFIDTKIESLFVIHGLHLVLYTKRNCNIMYKLTYNHSM